MGDPLADRRTYVLNRGQQARGQRPGESFFTFSFFPLPRASASLVFGYLQRNGGGIGMLGVPALQFVLVFISLPPVTYESNVGAIIPLAGISTAKCLGDCYIRVLTQE